MRQKSPDRSHERHHQSRSRERKKSLSRRRDQKNVSINPGAETGRQDLEAGLENERLEHDPD